jgi:hypothetical protein
MPKLYKKWPATKVELYPAIPQDPFSNFFFCEKQQKMRELYKKRPATKVEMSPAKFYAYFKEAIIIWAQ